MIWKVERKVVIYKGCDVSTRSSTYHGYFEILGNTISRERKNILKGSSWIASLFVQNHSWQNKPLLYQSQTTAS